MVCNYTAMAKKSLRKQGVKKYGDRYQTLYPIVLKKITAWCRNVLGTMDGVVARKDRIEFSEENEEEIKDCIDAISDCFCSMTIIYQKVGISW